MIDPTSILIFGSVLLLVTFALVAVLVFSPLKNKEKNVHSQRLLYCHGPSGQFLHTDLLSAEKIMRKFDDSDEWTATWLEAQEAIAIFNDINVARRS